MPSLDALALPLAIIGALFFGYLGLPILFCCLFAALILVLIQASTLAWGALALFYVLFGIPVIRRFIVSLPVMKILQTLNIVPKISETEQAALKAGDVWVEGELFSGRPNLNRLATESYPELNAEERAFLEGPCEELCSKLEDYRAWQEGDLPPEIWQYIKKNGFLGMIIPKEYGGLGFSALAHSEVIQKLASRSLPACISVMVPNSLGPAELLNHYGTDKQKEYYLPKLATGEEIPCFALTEPTAGSDAASIQAGGDVFRGEDGKLYIRLNWNKRWITLAAIATTIGLAFKLRDPENLLGKGEDIGITCALVPANSPGVTNDRKHDPLSVPFYNCPTQGKDVVVPIEAIIGGEEWAGRGWQMLMESLAAGRGISLPAQILGGCKLMYRVLGAHSKVRNQFGMSVGMFEGVQEALSNVGGITYLLEASRRYTLGALDSGVKPPVVTAIVKYNFTELGRKLINHGMDIQGGAAISRGPRNLIAHAYIATPISITVEGANILTRTLIVFGQGAFRAHPYAFAEIEALSQGNLKNFDRAFWGHVGHVIRNTFRSVLLSLSRGFLARPFRSHGLGRYYQKLQWSSASFALVSDIAMGALGGSLKARGTLTGRFADILSWMYMASATMRRYEAEGFRKEDYPFVKWSLDYAFSEIQRGFDGLFKNFSGGPLGWIFKGPIYWWSSLNHIGDKPVDKENFKIARLMQESGEQRLRFSEGIYVPTDASREQFALYEKAFEAVCQSEEIARKVRRARRQGKIKKAAAGELYKSALSAGIITQVEYDKIAETVKLRLEAIQVDDFPAEISEVFKQHEASASTVQKDVGS